MELTTKLRSDVRMFVAKRIIERNALMAKLEAKDRVAVKPPWKAVSFLTRPIHQETVNLYVVSQ